MKIVATNRKAFHDYHIMEAAEAGLVLTGTEIKAIRESKVNLREAYVRLDRGELWLGEAPIGPHFGHYAAGNLNKHDTMRPRKLLLHRDQIAKFTSSLTGKGATMVALKLYIKDHRAKVEVALAKGKKMYDKREAIAKEESKREMQRAIKSISRGGR